MFAQTFLILTTLAASQAAPQAQAAARADLDRAMQEVRSELRRVQARVATAPAAYSPRPRAQQSFIQTPPEPVQQGDPADSLYRAARQALNRNDYWRSADLFREVRSRYPASTYTPDAYYWEAYAKYRRGGEDALRQAIELLQTQDTKYPNAATRKSGDAPSLEARIQGELARRGDADAARVLAEEASRATVAPRAPRPPATPRAPRPPRPARMTDRCGGDEDDVQAAALNALMQMDADRALPILKKVLARRDSGSTCLRRKAVFLVSQHDTPETANLLLGVARSDPDLEVRSQAVFWLSQVDDERAVAALDSILIREKDREIQEKAIFALSQHDSPEAQRAIRRYVERSDVPPELQEKAIFWLGQGDDPENITFLKSLFGRVRSREAKERIIFALSQNDATDPKWLAEVARNQSEPIEVRKQALFWMSQMDETTGAELGATYGTFSDREMKEQVIFALSQKDDKAAIDKLIDIARREPDKELRKKAVFWLGQSDDPRVADVLAELLEKP